MKKTIIFFTIIIITFVSWQLHTFLISKTEANKNNSPELIATKDSSDVNTLMASSTVDNTIQNAETNNATSTNETQNEDATRDSIIQYTVQSGDVLGLIAMRFNITVNTLMWANNLNSRSVIRPGDILTILPTDGVMYKVKSGDTLSEIASNYNVDEEKIMATNKLSADNYLRIGEELIIPDAQLINSAVSTTKTVTHIQQQPATSSGITWTAAALYELNKIPSFVRQTVKNKVNAYAASHNIHVITRDVYKSIKV